MKTETAIWPSRRNHEPWINLVYCTDNSSLQLRHTSLKRGIPYRLEELARSPESDDHVLLIQSC